MDSLEPALMLSNDRADHCHSREKESPKSQDTHSVNRLKLFSLVAFKAGAQATILQKYKVF